jgi:hypothetical protein
VAQSGRSFLPLTGAVFAILFIASFLISGDVPGADDPASEVVAFYSDNESKMMVAGIIGAIAAIFFLFFAGYLRSVLRSAEGGPGTLSSVAAGGGIVATTGMLIFAGIGFTLTQDAEGFEPATVQTLNALNMNFFFPLAGGLLAFLLATGLVATRTRVLPPWLAWSAIVIAIVMFTPLGFFAFLASTLWILITSILLWTAQSRAPVPTV